MLSVKYMNWKRASVLFLLVITLFFGQDIQSSKPSPQKKTGGEIILTASDPRVELLELVNVIPGQVYRFGYFIKNISEDLGEDYISKGKISTIFEPKIGTPMQLSNVEVKNIAAAGQFIEGVAQLPSAGTLSLKITNDNLEESLSITKIRATLLNISNMADVHSLQSTIYASNTVADLPLISLDSNAASFSLKIDGSVARVTQPFKMTTQSVIGGVVLPAQKIGDGGNGQFSVQIDDSQNKVVYRKSYQTVKISSLFNEEKGRIDIPVEAYLSPGDYNFTISFERSGFSKRHGWELEGSNGGESGVYINRAHKKTLPGSLDMSLITVSQQIVNGVGLPSGTIVEDLGNGKYSFIYNFQDSSNSYLDYLLSLSSPDEVVGGFEQQFGGIVGVSSKKMSPVVLRYNFPFPAEKVSIGGRLIGGWANPGLLYSLNGNKWDALPNYAFTDIDQPIIRSNFFGKQTKKVFISVDPNLTSQKLSGQPYGISELKIEAELRK